jgi:hypothetical protein
MAMAEDRRMTWQSATHRRRLAHAGSLLAGF